MLTALELFDAFVASRPADVIKLFAPDGVLEIPYIGQIGMRTTYTGHDEVGAFYERLAQVIPTWRLRDVEIHMADDTKVFAEFFVDEPTSTPGRRFVQHFFALMVVEGGKIVRLREALDLVASARAFLPNGVADIPA